MNIENLKTVFALGQSNINVAVKTTRAKQGFVEHVDPVGSSNNNYTGIIIKTVHLDQNLVESLLIFATSATASVTLMSNGINFIDKDDGRGVFLSFSKEVAHARGTYTNKHFGKLGTRDAEEGYGSFASHSTSHEGFTSTWVASQQDTTWDFGTKFFILLGLFEKVYHFLQILFGGFVTSHIFESDAFFVRTVEFGLGLAKAHRLIVHGLSLAHHRAEEENNNDDWHYCQKQQRP